MLRKTGSRSLRAYALQSWQLQLESGACRHSFAYFVYFETLPLELVRNGMDRMIQAEFMVDFPVAPEARRSSR